MKKQTWEEPQILVQKFIPNEYIAACGDSGKIYKFTCDAGDGEWGSVYRETGLRPGLQTGGRYADEEITSWTSWPRTGYHACMTTHEAESDSEFDHGYYCAGGDTRNPLQVIIWRGEDGKNVHCTTNLDMDSWETERS